MAWKFSIHSLSLGLVKPFLKGLENILTPSFITSVWLLWRKMERQQKTPSFPSFILGAGWLLGLLVYQVYQVYQAAILAPAKYSALHLIGTS